MNNKRRFTDRPFQRPIYKRTRCIEQLQPQLHPLHPDQQRVHFHPPSQIPPDQSTYDPLHCVHRLERLSISHNHPPPSKTQVPQSNSANFLVVEGLSSNQGGSHSHSANPHSKLKYAQVVASHPGNPGSLPHHSSLSLRSSQHQNNWTQVVRKGIQNKSTCNQSSYHRNPSIPFPSQPQFTSHSSHIFIPDASRSIANLPKRASVVSPNAFAVLSSHYTNKNPSEIYLVPSHSAPTQMNPISKASKRNLQRSKKKGNKQVPVIINDDKQIDIVLDTNILLSYLHFLRALVPLLSSICRILVPQAVLRELDMQKNRQQPVEVYEAGRCSSENTMGSLARQATNWLLSITKSNFSNVLIQRIGEESEEMKQHMDADTRILSYAHKLFLQAKSDDSGAVIALLSNDNILRLRAQSEGICCLAMSDFHHSPRQMLNHLHKFVPHLSVPRPSACIGSSLSSSRSSDDMPPIGRPKPTPNTNRVPLKSWVPSEKDAQFTFASLLPNITKSDESAAPSGPEKELIRLKSKIQKPRACIGCKSDIQSILQVSPDKVHYYCPMCCEVICRGCMRVTGCNWDCPGPFHGKGCATMKCCAEGRAAILLELLGQLDGHFLTSYFKLSFKDGPKITHLYGDKALTLYMQATIALLMMSGEEDDRLGFLESILISSTLLDILSQTLLSSPFMRWHSRSELYMSAIKLIKTIFQSLTRPWMIINSEYLKTSTAGILSVNHERQKIVWNRVIETSHHANATSVKIQKLRESFPSLLDHVNSILHNGSASTSVVIREILDNSVHVPLCYILENLFRLSIETKQPRSKLVAITDDIQVTESFPCGLVQLREALLDLKAIYESAAISQPSGSTLRSKSGGHSGRPTDSDQERGDLEGESNEQETQGNLEPNHAVKLSVESPIVIDAVVARDGVLVKEQEIVLHEQVKSRVNGKKGSKLKGTDNNDDGSNQSVKAAGLKSTGSVSKLFDQVETLTIYLDESESDDNAIEIVH